jgi:hypothetical protein
LITFSDEFPYNNGWTSTPNPRKDISGIKRDFWYVEDGTWRFSRKFSEIPLKLIETKIPDFVARPFIDLNFIKNGKVPAIS